MPHTDPDLIALTIQQPWAELILRGIKTIEVRSVQSVSDRLIYLYTSKRLSTLPVAHKVARHYGLEVESLPTGKVVGRVTISDCRKAVPSDSDAACIPWSLLKDQYCWTLQNPEPFRVPVPAKKVPYGMWFYPFLSGKRHQA